MLTCTMDVLPESIWLRTTPGASAMGQPYVCTEAGQYLAQGHFSTARTHKESYLLFYTLRGAGLIEQGDDRVLLRAGQALLMDSRSAERTRGGSASPCKPLARRPLDTVTWSCSAPPSPVSTPMVRIRAMSPTSRA